ncbi:ATP-binding protein [Longimicrobium sp.]|uniref:ATP-binding protein n=1 Tax=Longimicrobium sp. TaxID=2029185 RepID=UPI002BEB8BEA|nr:ATP-binding protein [Longimicrobium sp.]HSU14655.1 ATP-binding protein [Longimicrobium sp.]
MDSDTFPPLLVDRERERDELSSLLRRGRPALALLTGRRRVGKTYLLSHVFPPEELFLYTAAQTTPELNRQQLITDLAAWSGGAVRIEEYPTWRTVFRLMADVAERRAAGDPVRPTVVVLDEFQYLADGDRGVAAVASELNAVWEQVERGKPRLPFLIVLAGSAVATMEALAGGGAPLYGRFAWHQKLQPFTYWHAAELAPFARPRDRALLYGVFGGTPRYLAAVDPARTVGENAADQLLSPRGEVRLLVETALDQEEGLREVSRYRAILRAVADGCTERNEVAQRAGLANDHGLRAKLATLVELGYLEERRNIDAKPNQAVRYSIADAAFRFYHRFVAPNASVLERYPAAQVWETAVAPHLDAYMGLEFERIATQAYDRRSPGMGLAMVERWGQWEGVDRGRRSLEVDIVAPLTDGRVMTGAVKWDAAPIGAGVHHGHLEMLRRAAEAGRAWAHSALEPEAPIFYVAAGGFSAAFREEAGASAHPVILWTIEDVYAPPVPDGSG